jgi:hypothetical protein
MRDEGESELREYNREALEATWAVFRGYAEMKKADEVQAKDLQQRGYRLVVQTQPVL